MPYLDSYREPTVLILQLAKTAICEAGGEFVGVQRGVPRAGNPDLVLFNDPMTGTTLALAVDDKHITVQRVQAKIERSRYRFAAMRDRSGNLRQSAPRNDRLNRQASLNEALHLSHQTSGSRERRTTGALPTIAPIASTEDPDPDVFPATQDCRREVRIPAVPSICNDVHAEHKPKPRCAAESTHRGIAPRREEFEMIRKSFVSTAVSMSLMLVLVPYSGRAQATAEPGAEQPNQEQSRLDTEMMSHQRAMDIILWRLQTDFQDVVKSKDGNGFVHDKAAVKTYKGDLEALSVVARQHKQLAADYERWCGQSFTADYEHWCGPDVKQNEMAEHQQRMKTILLDLSDTFNTYVTVDDHSIEGSPNKIQDALNAHRDALSEFTNAIKDHKSAVSQMMANGADSISVLPLTSPSLLPLFEKR